jgi:hypothetical protein
MKRPKDKAVFVHKPASLMFISPEKIIENALLLPCSVGLP